MSSLIQKYQNTLNNAEEMAICGTATHRSSLNALAQYARKHAEIAICLMGVIATAITVHNIFPHPLSEYQRAQEFREALNSQTIPSFGDSLGLTIKAEINAFGENDSSPATAVEKGGVAIMQVSPFMVGNAVPFSDPAFDSINDKTAQAGMEAIGYHETMHLYVDSKPVVAVISTISTKERNEAKEIYEKISRHTAITKPERMAADAFIAKFNKEQSEKIAKNPFSNPDDAEYRYLTSSLHFSNTAQTNNDAARFYESQADVYSVLIEKQKGHPEVVQLFIDWRSLHPMDTEHNTIASLRYANTITREQIAGLSAKQIALVATHIATLTQTNYGALHKIDYENRINGLLNERQGSKNTNIKNQVMNALKQASELAPESQMTSMVKNTEMDMPTQNAGLRP